MEEYLDIYNEAEEYIGTAPRSKVHKMGYWHKTFQCWFTLEENGKQYILFQKRCKDKDTYPLLFDITSAGHLAAGEDLKQGIREIKEELGRDVEYSELLPIGVLKKKNVEWNLKDFEFAHIFIFKSNMPLVNYKLQREELTALVKLELKSAIELFNNKVNQVRLSGIAFDEKGIYKKIEYEVTKESFVPHGDKYYNLVFNEAEKLMTRKNT
jgi:isopentenyldiphosphate isomerase